MPTITCETGASIKPGAQAPGPFNKKRARARDNGRQHVNRLRRTSRARTYFLSIDLGFASQALCFSPLRGHCYLNDVALHAKAPYHVHPFSAGVAKLVYAPDSKSGVRQGHVGSSPTSGTKPFARYRGRTL